MDLAELGPGASAVEPGRLQIVGAGLMPVAGTLIIAGFLMSNPWLTASGIGWASIGLLFMVVGFERPTYPTIHPFLLWSVTLFFGSALRPLYLLRQEADERSAFLFGLPDGAVVSGATLNLLFLLAAVLGYSFSGRPASPPSNRSTSYGPTLGAAVSVMAVSALAFVLYLGQLGLSFGDLLDTFAVKRRVEIAGHLSSVGYLTWVSAASVFVAMYLVFLRQGESEARQPARALIFAAALVGLAVPLINGSRDGLLQPVILLALVATDFGRRLGIRRLLSGVVLAALLITTFASLRSSASNELDTSSVLDVAVIGDSLLGTHNWAGSEKTAVIEARVPDLLPFQRGSTYTTAIVAPIPRAIWREKPSVRIGPLVGEKVFLLDRNGRTGLPPGAPGELFINFGYLGVPIGGLAFGVVLRLVYRKFSSTPENDALRLVFLVALMNLSFKLPGGDFAGVFTEILMSSLILLGLNYAFGRRTW